MKDVNCKDCIYYRPYVCKADDIIEHECTFAMHLIDPKNVETGQCDYFETIGMWVDD